MRLMWRNHHLVLTAITVLLVAVIGLNTASAAAFPCLTVQHQRDSATLNLEDGTYRKIQYAPSPDDTDGYPSPDGASVAVLRSDTLYLKTPDSETVLQMGVSVFMGGWSPDNRWFVYLWTDANKNGYIAVTDAHGHVVAQRSYQWDTSPADFQFDSWSADTNYFALLSQGGPLQVALTVWSVADLTVVNTGMTGPIAQYTCYWAEGYGIVECGFWSPTGQHIAYVLQGQTQQVEMLNPGQDYARSINITGEISGTGNLIWSPDGNYLAIHKEKPEMLYVVGPKSKVQIAAGTISNTDVGEGFHEPIIYWSEDSRSLFFVQSESDPDNSVLSAFRPETGEGSILSEVWDSPVNFDEVSASFAFGNQQRYVLTKRLNNSGDAGPVFDLRLIDTKTLRKTVLAERKPVSAIRNLYWTADQRFGLAIWDTGLAWASADGLQVHSVQLDDGETIANIRVSRDNQWLTYTAQGNGQTSTSLINLVTGKQNLLATGKTTAVSFFSPDSHLIAVQVDDAWQLWNIDGTLKRDLSWPSGGHLDAVTTLPYTQAFIGSQDQNTLTPWSPDGSILVLVGAVSKAQSRTEVFTHDGLHLKSIVSPSYFDGSFSQGCPSEF